MDTFKIKYRYQDFNSVINQDTADENNLLYNAYDNTIGKMMREANEKIAAQNKAREERFGCRYFGKRTEYECEREM